MVGRLKVRGLFCFFESLGLDPKPTEAMVPSNSVAVDHTVEAHIQDTFIYVWTHTGAYLLHIPFVGTGINF